MRLTNEELYRYAKVKVDKSNTPRLSRADFKLFYEEARNEWLALADKDFELTEKRRSDSRGFLLDLDFAGDKYTFIDEILFVKAVYTEFTNTCDSVNKYNLPVPPRTWDEAMASLMNPFQCPTDQAPIYVEVNGGLEIFSKTMPTKTTIVYIRRPTPFDIIGAPGGFTIENREQQELILDIAIAKIKLKFSIPGYEAMKNAEIPMNE